MSLGLLASLGWNESMVSNIIKGRSDGQTHGAMA